MCDNYSDNDISVRYIKNAGVFAARQLVFNLMMEDISFQVGPINLVPGTCKVNFRVNFVLLVFIAHSPLFMQKWVLIDRSYEFIDTSWSTVGRLG